MERNSFCKLIWFDLKTGLVGCGKYLLSLSGIVLLFCLTYLKIMESSADVGIMDCYYFIMKGREIYRREDGIPFELPMYWCIIYIVLYSLYMYFINNSLHAWNGKEFIYIPKRKQWWYSKCICCLVVFLICYTIIIAVIALSMMLGKGFSPTIPRKGLIEIVGIPFLSAYVLGIIQLNLSIRFGEKAGFLFVMVYLVTSVYFYQKLLIGNFLIPMRNQMLYPEGYQNWEAFLINLLFLIAAIVRGKQIVEKNDLLKKSKL